MLQHAPIIASLLLTLLPSLAQAQVNTEKLRLSPDEEGFTGSLGLGLTTKSGNVDFFYALAELGIGWRKGDDLAFLVASSRYASKRTRDDRIETPDDTLWSKDSRYNHAHMAALRYNRFFSDRVIGEVFSQVEFNEFLMLDLRTLGGLGPRIVLFEEDKSSGYIGIGYMAEYEQLDPEEISADEQADTLAHRATSYLSFNADIAENTTISSTTYYQPCIIDPSDFRVYNETEMAIDFTEHLAFKVSFKLRHDSKPPYLATEEDEDIGNGDVGDEATLKPTDLQLANKLSWEF